MAVGPINIYEYEPLAKERLSKSQVRLHRRRRHRRDYPATHSLLDAIVLRPKVMEDVSAIDTSTTVLGHNISFPVMPAPSGAHGRAHPGSDYYEGSFDLGVGLC